MGPFPREPRSLQACPRASGPGLGATLPLCFLPAAKKLGGQGDPQTLSQRLFLSRGEGGQSPKMLGLGIPGAAGGGGDRR